MNKTFISLLALSAAAIAAPAAAQGWQGINQRQAGLEARIDQGVRNGSLTRAEAVSLRGEFQAIARLEANYRRDGLSNWERSDLDRRFNALSARIRVERIDNNRSWDDPWGRGRWRDNSGQWMNINARQVTLERRIDVGVQSGRLSRSEATRLRAEFNDIVRLEARYRRDGLSQAERADLDRRFDTLSARIRWETADRNDRRR